MNFNSNPQGPLVYEEQQENQSAKEVKRAKAVDMSLFHQQILLDRSADPQVTDETPRGSLNSRYARLNQQEYLDRGTCLPFREDMFLGDKLKDPRGMFEDPLMEKRKEYSFNRANITDRSLYPRDQPVSLVDTAPAYFKQQKDYQTYITQWGLRSRFTQSGTVNKDFVRGPLVIAPAGDPNHTAEKDQLILDFISRPQHSQFSKRSFDTYVSPQSVTYHKKDVPPEQGLINRTINYDSYYGNKNNKEQQELIDILSITPYIQKTGKQLPATAESQTQQQQHQTDSNIIQKTIHQIKDFFPQVLNQVINNFQDKEEQNINTHHPKITNLNNNKPIQELFINQNFTENLHNKVRQYLGTFQQNHQQFIIDHPKLVEKIITQYLKQQYLKEINNFQQIQDQTQKHQLHQNLNAKINKILKFNGPNDQKIDINIKGPLVTKNTKNRGNNKNNIDGLPDQDFPELQYKFQNMQTFNITDPVRAEMHVDQLFQQSQKGLEPKKYNKSLMESAMSNKTTDANFNTQTSYKNSNKQQPKIIYDPQIINQVVDYIFDFGKNGSINAQQQQIFNTAITGVASDQIYKNQQKSQDSNTLLQFPQGSNLNSQMTDQMRRNQQIGQDSGKMIQFPQVSNLNIQTNDQSYTNQQNSQDLNQLIQHSQGSYLNVYNTDQVLAAQQNSLSPLRSPQGTLESAIFSPLADQVLIGKQTQVNPYKQKQIEDYSSVLVQQMLDQIYTQQQSQINPTSNNTQIVQQPFQKHDQIQKQQKQGQSPNMIMQYQDYQPQKHHKQDLKNQSIQLVQNNLKNLDHNYITMVDQEIDQMPKNSYLQTNQLQQKMTNISPDLMSQQVDQDFYKSQYNFDPITGKCEYVLRAPQDCPDQLMGSSSLNQNYKGKYQDAPSSQIRKNVVDQKTQQIFGYVNNNKFQYKKQVNPQPQLDQKIQQTFGHVNNNKSQQQISTNPQPQLDQKTQQLMTQQINNKQQNKPIKYQPPQSDQIIKAQQQSQSIKTATQQLFSGQQSFTDTNYQQYQFAQMSGQNQQSNVNNINNDVNVVLDNIKNPRVYANYIQNKKDIVSNNEARNQILPEQSIQSQKFNKTNPSIFQHDFEENNKFIDKISNIAKQSKPQNNKPRQIATRNL